jgi:hypothetical protein
MTDNSETQTLDPTPPPPPTPPAEPRPRWRDRRVGVLALVASIAAAFVIGGTLGAATGGLIGYGVGHHDRPDRPALVRFQDDGGSLPGRPQFQPPTGELPPGLAPEESEDSQS